MDVTITGPDGRTHPLTKDPLELAYDAGQDLFSAVAAGHDALASDPHADALFVRSLRFLIAPDDVIVGFQILEFADFETEAGNLDLLYTPEFHVPALGFDEETSAAEIIEAAQARYG